MCHGTFYSDITVCIEMFKITESSVTIKVKQGEDPNADNTQAAGIGQTESELQLNKAELIKKKKKKYKRSMKPKASQKDKRQSNNKEDWGKVQTASNVQINEKHKEQKTETYHRETQWRR